MGTRHMGSVTPGPRSKTRTCRDGQKALRGVLHTRASAQLAPSHVFLATKPSPHHTLNSQGAARARVGVCITGCYHAAVGTVWAQAPAGCHAVGAGRSCPQEGTKRCHRSEEKHNCSSSGCHSQVQISNAEN